jgi:hypothetical protein
MAGAQQQEHRVTVDQVISLISSIGTCIAAGFAALSLRELALQRRTSHKPELAISGQEIYSPAFALSGRSLPPTWLEKEPEVQQKEFGPLGHSFQKYSIYVFNLGNGAAKDIHVSWRYDVKALVGAINKLIAPNLEGISVAFNERNVLSMDRGEGKQTRAYLLDTELTADHPYLLPASIERQGLAVALPGSFMALVSLYNFLALDRGRLAENEVFDFDESLTKMRMNISCNDIAGYKYVSEFSLQVTVHGFHWKEDQRMGAAFDGFIDYVRVH